MQSLLLQSVVPLLLITYFLSINVELSLSQDDLQYANCSEAINCGGIGDISYPFWGVNRANYFNLFYRLYIFVISFLAFTFQNSKNSPTKLNHPLPRRSERT
ncbi:unnamed protein product [Prunus armeniaca]|uniref:Uncharacterized protein n=1 Tax=Prunus armeniaca TaxID=36596 RepID=A0A6J5UEK8_PRUAR|nr:unnamed protein product [Prunus armeniaca]